MPVLPYVTPRLELDADVAVVGPSRKLLGAGLGAAIDAHAEVLRFNRAPCGGAHVGDVGARTTLRALNSHVASNTPLGDGYPDADMGFIPALRNARVTIHGWASRDHEHGQPNGLHPSCTRHFITQSEVDPRIGIEQPTMGASMLWLLIEAGICPTVYGFDLDPATPRSHWWERRPSTSTHIGHALELERLREFALSGKITLIERKGFPR